MNIMTHRPTARQPPQNTRGQQYRSSVFYGPPTDSCYATHAKHILSYAVTSLNNREKCFLYVPRHAFWHVTCVSYEVQPESVAREIRELELDNWVEFWRVGSPRWLDKKWQEYFTVIWSESSCDKSVARKLIACPSDLWSEWISGSAVTDYD
jgi:hypothetical protein